MAMERSQCGRWGGGHLKIAYNVVVGLVASETVSKCFQALSGKVS